MLLGRENPNLLSHLLPQEYLLPNSLAFTLVYDNSMPGRVISTESETPNSFMVSMRQACSRGSDSLYIFWPYHLLFFRNKAGLFS